MSVLGLKTCTFGMALCVMLISSLAQLGEAQGSLGIPGNLSNSDITVILETYNYWRASAEPSSADMQKVEWNEKLAAAARSFSQKCIQESNPNRAEAVDFQTVGETFTVKHIGRRQFNYSVMLEALLSQRKRYNFDENSCSSRGACEGYKQIMSAQVEAIGCGYSKCESVARFPVPNVLIFICYYGPGGDPNLRPYEVGSPCSACKGNRTHCSNNLCVGAGAIPSAKVSVIGLLLVVLACMPLW